MDFFPIFPEFSQFQALKKVWANFCSKYINFRRFFSKKSVFSWRIIEFLNDLLEFFENLLEFFFGLSFFGLEFFSKCPKKKPAVGQRIFSRQNEIWKIGK